MAFENSHNMLYWIVSSRTRTCGIYEIRHVASGRRYIGSSANVEGRWRQHRSDLRHGKHHSRYLARAWNKYGAAAFVFAILEVVDNPDNIFAREQWHIDNAKAADPVTGFNVGPVAGSCLGVKLTDDARMKISAAMKNRPREVWERMAATKRGVKLGPCSEERKRRIGAANRGRVKSPETLAKMAAAKRGQKRSQAVRDKMAESQRRRRSAERAARPPKPDTRAFCWMTANEAARAIGMYLSGANLQQTADAFGRSKASIWSLLKRKGIATRPRSAA